MARILIVEGNDEERIARAEQAGRRTAWRSWADALALHEPQTVFDVAFPCAPRRQGPMLAVEAYDGFVLTGSGVPWTAADAEAVPFLRFVEPMLATGRPVLGCCWGLQVGAVLLGGRVGANERGSEVGVSRDIGLTAQGATHEFYRGSPQRFDSVTWHRDHVTELPAGAALLASNPVSRVQAMAVENGGVDFFGMQYHPEAELEEFRIGFERSGARADAPGMIADFPETQPAEVADPRRRTIAVGNWLRRVSARA